MYPTQDEPNLDLANGRIDYVVGDGLVEMDFIEKKGNGCCPRRLGDQARSGHPWAGRR